MLPIWLIAFGLLNLNQSTRPVSFNREIMPALTRLGCNQGACHGKGAGQNGFRLSLRGYAPELDHAWLTREYGGRRFSPVDPQDSPLIRKITGQAAHEGGKLIQVDDPFHRLLTRWVAEGMPGPSAAEQPLQTMHLEPAQWFGKVGDSMPLKAMAVWADGQRTDVTWLTRFTSSAPAVASVSVGGFARIEGSGEAALQASFLTGVAVTRAMVPFSGPAQKMNFSSKNPSHPIDSAIQKHLRELNIPVSELVEDAVWVRRIHLDLCGRLPEPERVRAFLADKNPDKHALLVDELLATDSFNDIWTLFLSELLQNRQERDHDVRGLRGVRSLHAWLRGEVAANTGWNALARRILLASGTVGEDPAVGYWTMGIWENKPVESEMPGMISQAFLGTRIGCAQCHNHPTEKFTQEDYLRQAAYLSRLKIDRKSPRQGETALIPIADEKIQTGISHPRLGTFLQPRPLDRSVSGLELAEAGSDPRVGLVHWITDPKNPYFAKAMANRVWRHLLGRGLVEPVDDLRATNPPSNPEVLDLLENRFRNSGYNFRDLIRFIATTDAYRRSSSTLPGNKTDDRNLSHFVPRRLPAEVLLDALCQATGVSENFPGHPVGTRATQLPDPAVASRFLSTFGRSERVTACACEKTGDVTLPQILFLINSDTLVEKINNPKGLLRQLEKRLPQAVERADSLHWLCLSRPMDAATTREIERALAEPGALADEVLGDLVWSLLNSREFSFQH